jgi:hypothetical protein
MQPKIESFGSVNLFFDVGEDPTSSTLSEILAQYTPKNKSINGTNLTFDLEDCSFDQVNDMLHKVLNFLDKNKRSQAILFLEDGTIRCLTVNSGKVNGLN